jgi:hypothetical protein
MQNDQDLRASRQGLRPAPGGHPHDRRSRSGAILRATSAAGGCPVNPGCTPGVHRHVTKRGSARARRSWSRGDGSCVPAAGGACDTYPTGLVEVERPTPSRLPRISEDPWTEKPPPAVRSSRLDSSELFDRRTGRMSKVSANGTRERAGSRFLHDRAACSGCSPAGTPLLGHSSEDVFTAALVHTHGPNSRCRNVHGSRTSAPISFWVRLERQG